MDSGSILIVDDDPVVVQVLGKMLADFGQVRFALSGAQALALTQEALPDLILLDAEMPDMSGYEVCRLLKTDPLLWDIPVIFITQHDEPDSELMALETGAVDFIGKPPKQALVSARVRTHLRLKQVSDELRRHANTDALTGAANRRQFDFLYEREWERARRAGTQLSLLMIDIDHFKLYNDHYGHPQGDDCLRQVAQTVATLVQRPADAFARVGGEEFVALLPDTDEHGARYVAQRIVEGVAAAMIPHASSPVAPYVSVSVGGSTITWPAGAAAGHVLRPTTEPVWRSSDLMQCADKALYAAKHAGRGCSRIIALPDANAG
jgi:diguanylate cyclase (GGDEF)-like protein